MTVERTKAKLEDLYKTPVDSYLQAEELLDACLKAIDEGHEEYAYDVANIYFHGGLGDVDYQKAFEYYSRAALVEYEGDEKKMQASLLARLKLAGMYKYGLYVDQSYEQYRQIIEELYREAAERDLKVEFFEPTLEMGKILLDDGKIDEGVQLLLEAKKYVAIWVKYYGICFEDLVEINDIIYQYIPFDYDNIGPEDVTYLLTNTGWYGHPEWEIKTYCTFECDDKLYHIDLRNVEGRVLILFGLDYYCDVYELLEEATIGGEPFVEKLFSTEKWKVFR